MPEKNETPKNIGSAAHVAPPVAPVNAAIADIKGLDLNWYIAAIAKLDGIQNPDKAGAVERVTLMSDYHDRFVQLIGQPTDLIRRQVKDPVTYKLYERVIFYLSVNCPVNIKIKACELYIKIAIPNTAKKDDKQIDEKQVLSRCKQAQKLIFNFGFPSASTVLEQGYMFAMSLYPYIKTGMNLRSFFIQLIVKMDVVVQRDLQPQESYAANFYCMLYNPAARVKSDIKALPEQTPVELWRNKLVSLINLLFHDAIDEIDFAKKDLLIAVLLHIPKDSKNMESAQRLALDIYKRAIYQVVAIVLKVDIKKVIERNDINVKDDLRLFLVSLDRVDSIALLRGVISDYNSCLTAFLKSKDNVARQLFEAISTSLLQIPINTDWQMIRPDLSATPIPAALSPASAPARGQGAGPTTIFTFGL